MATSRKRTLEEIFDSDSDDDEDFEGFSSQSESDDDTSGSESDAGGDESDDQEPPPAEEWTNHYSPIMVNDFTGASGPNLPDHLDVNTASPLEYFWTMFSPDMFAEIARYTNGYARWRMDQTGENDPHWTETTPQEIRAFVGMEVLMGINRLPDSSMYWSRNRRIGNVGIQEIMTANRYQKIKQYFHVSDRAAEPGRGDPAFEKLYKVRPILEHVTENFRRMYTLGRDVAVDEAMVKYTGKLSFRQYMPAKPIKRGIKVWMACDSNTAYLSRMKVYLGRNTGTDANGLGYNVVKNLTDNLHGSDRHIYFDNFFTSIPLMQFLLNNGLYSCGTVRINRAGFPTALKKPREIRERGESKTLQFGVSNLTATVWKDKRLVHNLSTIHQPQDIQQAQRRVGQDVLQVDQPGTVHDYNKYMGGVDMHDQLRMKYKLGRNSKKWWRYLFWFFVNCAIVNSYILFKLTSRRPAKKKRFRHLEFRIEMAEALIAGFTNRKRKGPEQERVGLVEPENIGGHIQCRLPLPRGRCRVHLKDGVRKETIFGCSICRVHLCRDGCHGRYHN